MSQINLRSRIGAASIMFAASALIWTSANATTYVADESLDGATVSLSITTDGVTGILGTSDILSWNILITDSAGSVTLDPTAGEVVVVGSVLSATATDLSFDFGSDRGAIGFQNGTLGKDGPFWCATNGGCYGEYTPSIGVSTQYGLASIEQVAYNGETVIATSGVPEPSTWAMMWVGFVGVGLAVYRRARSSDVSTSATA